MCESYAKIVHGNWCLEIPILVNCMFYPVLSGFTDPMDHRAFMYPVVYVLLKKKTKAAYRQMFNGLNILMRPFHLMRIIHLLIIHACYAN